jgi:hypothetical protein
MIPALSVAGRGRSTPSAVSFGPVVDRINLLKPYRIAWSGGDIGSLASTNVQTNSAANSINQWIPGDPSQDRTFPIGSTTPTYVSFSGPVAGPGGAVTAYKLAEVMDDVVVPAYPAKPVPWALTGFNSKWASFWSHCVACVPCWEGTGAPNYYTAGGVLGPALTQVGSPTWGTVDGSSIHFEPGANDWRIMPVAGNDIFPTAHGTFLMVRKPTSTANNSWGILSTLADGLFWLIGIVTSGTGTFGWGNAFSASFPSYPVSTTEVIMEALVVGTTGTTAYRRSASSGVQGIRLVTVSNVTTRVKGNNPFSLTMGYGGGPAIQEDVMFFACLDEEWTQDQVLLWMNDPYGPIRTDGGSATLHPGRSNIHYALAGCCYLQRISPPNKVRLRFATFAKASGRSRFKFELSIGSTAYVNARSTGVSCIFDVVGGNATVPVAFGAGSGGSPPTSISFTPGPATITPVAGAPGWFYCTMDAVTCVGINGTDGGVVCVISTDAGSGLGAENILFAAPGGDGIIFAGTRLLPPGAFALNTTLLFDDFDDFSTIDEGMTQAPGFNWYGDLHWPASFEYPPYVLTPPGQVPSTFCRISAPSILTIDKDGGVPGLVSFSWPGGGTPDATGSYPVSSCVGNFFHPPAFFEIKSRFPDIPTGAGTAHAPPVFWTVAVENYLQHNWFNPTTPDALGNIQNPSDNSIQPSVAAAGGATVLTFSYVPLYYRKPGMRIYDNAVPPVIPNGTKIVSATSTTITIDHPLNAPGVTTSSRIHMVYYVENDFYEVVGWANPTPAVAHYPYCTLIDSPGYWSQTGTPIGPTNSSGSAFHLYQHLWLAETVDQYGLSMSFYDGIYWDVNVAGVAGNPNLKIYGANIAGDPTGTRFGTFTTADNPAVNNFVVWIGACEGWPQDIDWVRIIGP